MRLSMTPGKASLVNMESMGSGLNLASLKPTWGPRDKAVIVLGATGTGKSRLAIDLATRFPAEVINSDKMQVYKGLDIVTNKVTDEESRGVRHHLLSSCMETNSDFTAAEFCYSASRIADGITGRGRVPIIAGGSNSFVDALVNDHVDFSSRYECCFVWVHVALPVLHSFVSERVDRMIESGLVNEVRGIFDPNETDYSRGIRRAIGVPEMDEYLRSEMAQSRPFSRGKLLKEAFEQIKRNTCDLSCRQLRKIQRLPLRSKVHLLDSTDAVLGNESWEKTVAAPAAKIISKFLKDEREYSRLQFLPARVRLPAVAGSTN